MGSASLRVLYEDNHLLAVDKPAGMATMGLRADKETLLTKAKDYVKKKYHKPGNVYLGVLSRLDAPVTGVVLFARTSKAAARLTAQFRDHRVEKVYWALVEGQAPAEGDCLDWLVKDERHRKVHIASAETAGAQSAQLHFRRLACASDGSLLEVQLLTGRKHQIRVQLARRGHPILGDRKYGGLRPFPRGIALHARRLVVDHPVRHEPLELVAPLPEYWPMRVAGDE